KRELVFAESLPERVHADASEAGRGTAVNRILRAPPPPGRRGTLMHTPQMRDEALGRAIPFRGLAFPFDDRQQAGGQLLAQFDAPLIEGIDVPDRRFDEDGMLLERDKPAGRGWIDVPGDVG